MQQFLRYVAIIIGASLLFFPFLGHTHLFDWDEINFAECAREMIVSKNYLRMQIDFQPFWEKPPLFIWMQVLSMKLFGVNEFAARFPNAVTGVLTLCILYYAGKRIVNEKMGVFWVLMYASAWLPHIYFKSGIIDPTFNLFIFLSFLQFYFITEGKRKLLHALFSGIFLGLAVMTKGPVAILIAGLSFAVLMVVNRGWGGYKFSHLLVVVLATAVTASIWFCIEIYNHGWWFVNEFIKYQVRLFSTEDADHGGPFIYHWIVLLFGCFPAAAFLFQYSRKKTILVEDGQAFAKWMWIMFWVVLLLFSIVKTKIVHYSSLCYFPLTYLAALQVYRLTERKSDLKLRVRAILLFTGLIIAVCLISLPLVGIYKAKLIPLINDPFAVGNLDANVPWSYAEMSWGILYFIGIIAAVVIMRHNFRKAMIALVVLQILIIQFSIVHFTPKIEAYTQRAAIDYFKSLKGKDVYICVMGYKSYAQLFYAEKMHATKVPSMNEKMDKPAYYICKVQDADQFRNLPLVQEIGSLNGFVFFRQY
ncbi:MAG: glycosyltransferase family 39 protein [Bacteroidetes bacterium]|nr:glycosyltransferase family 39 protein [Bacteroidota bacterium]